MELLLNNKRRVILDTETNRLIKPDKIWCIVCKDIDTNEIFTFSPNTPTSGQVDFLEDFIQFADTCATFIGHNIVAFDRVVINLHCNRVLIKAGDCTDTLVLSRLLRPVPSQHPKKGFYNREYGHGLEAWGKYLGSHKIDFHQFDKFTQEMLDYCIQDVNLTHLVYNELMRENAIHQFSQQSIDLEHQVAQMLHQQVENGFYLDQPKALKLKEDTQKLLEEMDEKLQTLFPPVFRLVRNYTPKPNKDGTLGKVPLRILETYSTSPDLRCEKKEDGSCDLLVKEVFNPQSGDQIAKRLQGLGWIPKYLTEKGNIKTDKVTLQDALKTLLEASPSMVELRCLADYSIIADRNETASKWLEMVGDPEGYNDGRVHGAINPIGAGTHRCSHYCVPMHSTILTRHGWKTYEQVIVGEDVMAYDMTKHVKCWTPLLAKNKFENVEIGSIGQKSLRKRLLCTKNHAWVVRTGRRRFNATEQLREAGDIGKHAAVLINAPFVNDIIKTDFKLINEKYTKDWTSEVCKLSDVELNAMLQGFLLADGYLKAGCRWSFAQAEGNLCEAFLTALYLISTNRVSACQKSRLKGPNQRWGFNVTTTQNQYMRTQDMTWRPEYVGDVWCPTTALNTWVMKQDDFITITGNSPNMANIPRVVTCSRPASSYDVVGLNKFDQLPDGDIFLGTKGDKIGRAHV